jgi:hypothetical protein
MGLAIPTGKDCGVFVTLLHFRVDLEGSCYYMENNLDNLSYRHKSPLRTSLIKTLGALLVENTLPPGLQLSSQVRCVLVSSIKGMNSVV